MKRNNGYLVVALAATLLAGTGLVIGSDDRDDDDEHRYPGHRVGWLERSGSRVGPVPDGLYRQECGDCHFPYQAELLPAASWRAIMAGLADHFGDNAELDEAEQRAIGDYLQANAADHNRYRISGKILRSPGHELAPLRITATRFFRHEHDELPARLVTQNPEVASFANCGACHRDALQGDYDEDRVRIAGYGRWDD